MGSNLGAEGVKDIKCTAAYYYLDVKVAHSGGIERSEKEYLLLQRGLRDLQIFLLKQVLNKCTPKASVTVTVTQ